MEGTCGISDFIPALCANSATGVGVTSSINLAEITFTEFAKALFRL